MFKKEIFTGALLFVTGMFTIASGLMLLTLSIFIPSMFFLISGIILFIAGSFLSIFGFKTWK